MYSIFWEKGGASHAPLHPPLTIELQWHWQLQNLIHSEVLYTCPERQLEGKIWYRNFFFLLYFNSGKLVNNCGGSLKQFVFSAWFSLRQFIYNNNLCKDLKDITLFTDTQLDSPTDRQYLLFTFNEYRCDWNSTTLHSGKLVPVLKKKTTNFHLNCQWHWGKLLHADITKLV